MKKRKRILSGILAAAFLLTLSGCEAGKPADTSPIEDTTQETTDETAAAAETALPETQPIMTEHDHIYIAYPEFDPTCTEKGGIPYICNCGVGYVEETKAALEHAYVSQTIVPAETAQGCALHTCSRCGHSYTD